MAQTQKTSPNETPYKKDYLSDWAIHRTYILTFDAYEAMLLGQVYDSVSNSIDGSKITDSYTATLAIERAARVMGKLPDGVVEATAKADVGKAAFMDILRQKWIYPNANAQHCFDTKLRLWQLYSSVYGYMPMFYDWNVSPNGYVGPDCWLWNPRNLIPQQGRVSIEDMDYVTALTWCGKKYLENILGEPADPQDTEREDTTPDKVPETMEDGWDRKALQELIDAVGEMATTPDAEKDTRTARTRTPEATKKGICLATRYESGDDGEWVTFAPDHGFIEVRRLKNPHKNGRIPFVIKYSQPLFDSFYGLGDFQRAKPLQFARDGLTNFYFKGIKMNLIPPIIANANGVMKHTLDYREGAVMLETIPNSIRRLETSTAGLATFQAAQSNLTGSLLSLFGSQNAAAPGSETLNPSQGKTPAAIGLYSDKEATRDGQERMYLETAIESLTDGFFSMVVNIGTEEIPIALFSKDIEEIVKQGMTDVVGLFSGKFQPNEQQTGGQLKIDPAALKGVEYRFKIDEGSTAKANRDAQLKQLNDFMTNIAKFQNQFKDDPRIDVNWAKIMEAEAALTDIPGADEFITITPGPSPQQIQQQQQQQEMALKSQQAQQSAQPEPQKAPFESITFKDAVAAGATDAAAAMLQQAGLPANSILAQHPAPGQVVGGQVQQPQPPEQPQEPQVPTYVKGQALKDPHVIAAAQHLVKS